MEIRICKKLPEHLVKDVFYIYKEGDDVNSSNSLKVKDDWYKNKDSILFMIDKIYNVISKNKILRVTIDDDIGAIISFFIILFFLFKIPVYFNEFNLPDLFLGRDKEEEKIYKKELSDEISEKTYNMLPFQWKSIYYKNLKISSFGKFIRDGENEQR